jgi:hypothetical protein
LQKSEDFMAKLVLISKSVETLKYDSIEFLALKQSRANLKRRMKDETRRRLRWKRAMGG